MCGYIQSLTFFTSKLLAVSMCYCGLSIVVLYSRLNVTTHVSLYDVCVCVGAS